MMTPKQYLDRYTYFSFTNPLTGLAETAPITRWGSNWGDSNRNNGTECHIEHNAYFTPAVHKAIDGKADFPLPKQFFLAKDYKSLSAYEGFYDWATIRTFCGKGSPDEIADTIRLAVIAGRIGTGKDLAGRTPACRTVAEYVKRFVTIDCNAYVGNYYGLDPSIDLDYYASKATRRMRVADIRQGDVVVTIKPGNVYKHVALIDEIWAQTPSAAIGSAAVTLCEWGRDGGEDNHYSTKGRDFILGPHKEYGLCWKDGAAHRYVFAPPLAASTEPRGWGLNGKETR